MYRHMTTKDLVEVFFGTSIYDIKEEKETPNINFIFNDNYNLLNELVNDPEFHLHRLYPDDLEYYKSHLDDDCITVEVHDINLFFELLNELLTETILLFADYDDEVIVRETAIYLLRRIWLRMGPTDIENIESFLQKQIEFTRNRKLDSHNQELVNTYEGLDVYMKTRAGEMWDETTRNMTFTIKDNKKSYELPHILYDIDDSDTCYIYGVQSSQGEKDKHIERKLYKLNKGIENPNVHPSKVCSLLLFIEELRKNNISKIVVPGIQVLSYRYHELLSQASKINLEEAIEVAKRNPKDRFFKERVEYLRDWYNRVYEKQDIISYLKTEELYNLLYRITEHNPDFIILNDVMIEGDSIQIKLK